MPLSPPQKDLYASAALGEKDPTGLYDVRVQNRDGKVVLRKVRIGLDNKISAQVLSGLSESQRVVLGEASAKPAVQEMRRPARPGECAGPRVIRDVTAR